MRQLQQCQFLPLAFVSYSQLQSAALLLLIVAAIFPQFHKVPRSMLMIARPEGNRVDSKFAARLLCIVTRRLLHVAHITRPNSGHQFTGGSSKEDIKVSVEGRRKHPTCTAPQQLSSEVVVGFLCDAACKMPICQSKNWRTNADSSFYASFATVQPRIWLWFAWWERWLIRMCW